MKKFFGKLPVKHKLNVIILSICSVTLLLTFVIVFFSQWFIYQRNTLEELQSLAKVIGGTSTAALLSQDHEALEKNLHSLSQQPSILKTTVYSLNNIAVASYSQNTNQKKIRSKNIINSELKQKGYLINNGSIDILTPIILDREIIGFLYLKASMSKLKKTLFEAAGYLLVILYGGVILAVFMANRLQRIITRPVTRLASVIQQVLTKQNYHLRVEQEGEDEFGLLAKGFNNMLSHIQSRDEYLEKQVHDSNAKLQLPTDEAIIIAEKSQVANKTKSQRVVALMADDQPAANELITRCDMAKELTTFNAKILLAEDNFINQQVAKEVLQKLGCHVDLAVDGNEAVAAAEKKSYDIIFMDCQMPTMDGYGATNEIRRMGIRVESDKNIPIIALTANALSGDREKCLMAGMDDYVSKPFQQERIADVLKKWLPANLQSVVSNTHEETERAESEQANNDAIDHKILNNILNLQVKGAEDLLKKVVKLFLKDTPLQLEELRQALQEKDVEMVSSIAHSLKSGSATVGAMSLSSLMKKLEENARRDSLKGAFELLSSAEEEFLKTIEPLSAVDGECLVDEGDQTSGDSLILVVDDDLPTRLLIRASLEKEGFRVTEAKNGSIAVTVFEQLKPDAILLDVMMPLLDGFDTCRAIRKLPAGEHTPILMVTGLDDIDSIHRSFNAGATDFISKPINGAIVSYKVKYMLRASSAFHDVIDNQKQIQKLAFFDHLTGLPNRTMFSDTLEAAIADSKENETQLAVLFMDLDRFKTINDTLGHHAGDILLKSVAERIGSCIRATDLFSLQKDNYAKSYISRQGGDEFTVMLPRLKDPENAGRIARRINEALAKSFQIEVHEVYISASIGISIFPIDGSDAETLMKHADLAMYHAKDKGKNGFQFYKKALNIKAIARFGFENDVRKAVAAEEFTLYYQPQVSLADGTIIAAEALSRWNHSSRGIVSPKDFIPAIEELGLIGPFTDSVIRQACTQKFKWSKAGITPTRIALNISSKHFAQQQIPAKIFEVLKKYNLDANFLELELTESVLAEQNTATLSILKELKTMGLTISVDDFGTGYSSLVYLKTFPIDIVKIDRFFIKDILTSQQDASIVKAIIAMAHSMEMKVIAEGIEKKEQFDLLQKMGCDFGQGYLFSPAVSAEALSEMIKNGVSLIK